MQSLLTDTFNRTQKTIPKPKKQLEEDDDQQEESKREEQDQYESEDPAEIQAKKSESSEELEAMKDAFQSDESYLFMTEDLRDERLGHDPHGGNGAKNAGQGENGAIHAFKMKKIAKRRKDFQWKYLWVRQQNAVKGSKPIWLRKWVKVKVSHENGDPEQIPQEQSLNVNQQIKQN